MRFKFAWLESLVGASIVVLVGLALGWGGVEIEVQRGERRKDGGPPAPLPHCGCPEATTKCANDVAANCTTCCGTEPCPGVINPSACACGH